MESSREINNPQRESQKISWKRGAVNQIYPPTGTVQSQSWLNAKPEQPCMITEVRHKQWMNIQGRWWQKPKKVATPLICKM